MGKQEMNEIQFVVPGNPVGKGRAKAARRGKFITMYTPEKTANYEGLVAHSAQVAMNGRPLISGPIAVELDIRISIPASWSGKRKGMAQRGEIAATKKPDIDNVEKAIFDGLNGVVWKDDVQAVHVSKRKRYAETPGAVVIVRELELMPA
jgi:Holliday junction resolvase RusA-like endonuclease